MSSLLPNHHPDGRIIFESQEALDMWVSACHDSNRVSEIEHGFEIGRKQALEVIEAFPDKTPGQNQFKQDIYAALEKAAIKLDANQWCNVSEVRGLLLKLMIPVIFENGYPVQAVTQATILSLPQLILMQRRQNG